MRDEEVRPLFVRLAGLARARADVSRERPGQQAQTEADQNVGARDKNSLVPR